MNMLEFLSTCLGVVLAVLFIAFMFGGLKIGKKTSGLHGNSLLVNSLINLWEHECGVYPYISPWLIDERLRINTRPMSVSSPEFKTSNIYNNDEAIRAIEEFLSQHYHNWWQVPEDVSFPPPGEYLKLYWSGIHTDGKPIHTDVLVKRDDGRCYRRIGNYGTAGTEWGEWYYFVP